ncbi:MAG: hypothetical protein JST92_09405 [Deltaproteobacteria bacterium]|nr:hypothetical protein [Deltaproteobacteria bacterium]
MAPLWTAPHLPFTDLPQHVAMISTLRHWWDPVFRVREHFTLALGQTQYLLYYLLGAVMAFPFGTAERANLVLLSLIGISFPFSLRSLLRALGADERLAMFGGPLFWSQALLIGFFNYVAAMPLVLWGLALAVREAEVPKRAQQAGLAVLALAIFYMHLSAFVFWAPAAAIAFWMLPPAEGTDEGTCAPLWKTLLARLPKLPMRLLWAIPVTLAALLFVLKSPVVHPQSIGWHQDMAPQYEDVGSALRNLLDALLDIWRGVEDEWILVCLITVAGLLSWPQKRDEEKPSQSLRRALVAVWLVFAAALYFFFPKGIGWLWQLNERYALVFALLFPLLLRPARGLKGAVPLLALAAVTVADANIAIKNIRVFEEEVGPFDRVLEQAEPGKHLLSMIVDQNSRVAKFSAFLHFGSYYRARKGGIASFSFAELPQSPLRYKPQTAPPAKPPGWEWHAFAFDNVREGPYYDYILLHGNVDPLPRVMQNGGPKWRLKTREGSWSLYEREP